MDMTDIYYDCIIDYGQRYCNEKYDLQSHNNGEVLILGLIVPTITILLIKYLLTKIAN